MRTIVRLCIKRIVFLARNKKKLTFYEAVRRPYSMDNTKI